MFKYILIFCVFIVLAGCNAATHNQPPATASNVDLQRYLGKWYEIASFPMFFQRGCHCTTAEYTLAHNYISVKNSCRRGSPLGNLSAVSAKAYPSETSSKLKVQFFWPFKGDYWILYVDKNYQHAVVGVPSRRYLWILSRTPSLPQAIYQQLVKVAQREGFAVSHLRLTDQACALAEI